MTTTPLPKLPRALHRRPVQVSKTGTQLVPMWEEDQMQAYATQARADLEAENQRLRALLEEISRANAAQVAPVYSELARAALESKHGL